MNIVVRVLAEGFYRIMYDLRFEGLENISKNGGTIYASNHRSYHDPVFITMRVPKKFNYMAKEELFKNKIFGSFITMLGAFPIQRGTGDMAALDKAIDKVKNGENLVIFPEGTRSYDGKVGKGKTGVALVAAKAGVDVIPVGICFEGPKLKFRQKVTVKFGKPISAASLHVEGTSSKELKVIKNTIMQAITELVEGPAQNEG